MVVDSMVMVFVSGSHEDADRGVDALLLVELFGVYSMSIQIVEKNGDWSHIQ